jgi:putative transposase
MKQKQINRRCFQQSLDTSVFKNIPKEFGGENLKSHAKTARPITTKQAMHMVLRSSLATHDLSFLHKKRRKKIEAIILTQAKKFYIKIYRLAINSNHVHALIKLSDRASYKKFIRSVSGLIARLVLGVKRGRALLLPKFWDYLPFTRIVAWGSDFNTTAEYIVQNILESEGLIPYKNRANL